MLESANEIVVFFTKQDYNQPYRMNIQFHFCIKVSNLSGMPYFSAFHAFLGKEDIAPITLCKCL